MDAQDLGRSGAALLIGVGDYLESDRVGRLRFAERDAQALAEVLTEPNVCGFPPERVLLLKGTEARRDEIVGRLSRWLSQVARGAEIVFLYFAGHGAVQRVGLRDEGFLLPYDADPEDLLTRGVSMSDLARWIEGIEAAAVVVCLDCCHAGRVLTRQGNVPPSEVRDVKLRPSLLQGLAGKGHYLIASCDEGQVSIEVETHGHGLFTYHLLRGLRGAADRDGDGRVGVAELFEFVAEAVETDAKRLGFTQKPWNHSTGTGGVYLSRPRGLKGSSRPSAAAEGEEREEHNRNSIHQVERLFAEGPEDRLVSALDDLWHLDDAEAVPFFFRGLTHSSRRVRERARKALRSLGWERTTSAVEVIARKGDPERIGQILDGLAAFESHRDVVALLDRLVALLQGDLRNRAILLWERKRLALDLEDVAEVFRAVASPYQLQRALGQGLFTAAYLARDEQTDLNVVIRVLRPEFAAQPALRARFLDMARGSLRYVHQNLVLTREVRSLPDRKIDYVVRDYVEGATLQRMLEAGKAFTPAQIVKILRQLLQALTPLHEAGLAHGGIKPSNIFVRGDDRVILGDPSLPLQGIHLALDRLSYDYRYAAPETFRAGNTPAPTADLYALGCLGYELACGSPPFVADSPFELAAMHDREPVASPIARGSHLGPGDHLLMRLLAKTPRDRFGSLEEAIGAIDKLTLHPRGAVGAASRTKGMEFPSPARSDGPGPIVGEISMIRYQSDQSIISFDTNSVIERSRIGRSDGEPDRPANVDPETLSGVEGETSLPTGSAQNYVMPEQIGSYAILKLIGQGGMGQVYLARDVELGRQVALKLVPADTSRGHGIVHRLKREARALASFSHPNIVSIYSLFFHDKGMYIALEYVEGGTLREMLNQGPLTPRTAVELMLTLARAVHFAHERGITHRDLKPSNIKITE